MPLAEFENITNLIVVRARYEVSLCEVRSISEHGTYRSVVLTLTCGVVALFLGQHLRQISHGLPFLGFPVVMLIQQDNAYFLGVPVAIDHVWSTNTGQLLDGWPCTSHFMFLRRPVHSAILPEHYIEIPHDVRVLLDEMKIQIARTEEAFQLSRGLWKFMVTDGAWILFLFVKRQGTQCI